MKKLTNFQCVVALIDGKLHRADLLPNGDVDFWAGSFNWKEVKGPLDQTFIEAVNEALGTHFSEKDFLPARSQRS